MVCDIAKWLDKIMTEKLFYYKKFWASLRIVLKVGWDN